MRHALVTPSLRARMGLGLLALAASAPLAPGVAAPASAPAPSGMTTYQLVLLRAGTGGPALAEHQAARTQRAHLDYREQLLDEGKLLAAGPIDGGGELREVLVLDVGSTEEADALLGVDARVANGELRAEVLSWWAADGLLTPGDPERLVPALFGLLVRPENAPGLPEHRQREIQQGHLANIRHMAELGDLVIAGPLDGDTPLRGVLVFRTTDRERVRELVAGDPAVEAGRLVLELYRWNVPAGTLPEPR